MMALLLGPFGPILRYLGWLVAIVGICRKRDRWKEMLVSLPVWVKVTLPILLGWGAIITILQSPDIYQFLKGWSVLIEFVFAVLLSCFVLRVPEAFMRWFVLSRIIVVVLGLNAILWFMFNGAAAGAFQSFCWFYSTIAIPLAPFVLLPLFSERKTFSGVVSDIFVLFCFLVMVLTGLTSGAILALAGTSFVMLILVRPGIKQIGNIVARLFMAAILVFLLSVFSGKEAQMVSRVANEFGQIFALDDSIKMSSGRSLIWKDTLRIFSENPAGIGWGMFEDRFSEFPDMEWFSVYSGPPSAPHNEFLSVLVEGGIVSLFAYVVFWSGCLRILYRRLRIHGKNSQQAILLSSAMTGIFLFSMVGGIFDERKLLAVFFWTIFGAVIAQDERYYPKREKEEARGNEA